MRMLRLALVSATFIVGLAAPVAAQTTTTMPPVRSIPVTSGTATTTTTAAPSSPTTTAPAAVNSSQTAAPKPLASTGFAADELVPLGLLLVGLGAALVAAARRPRRPLYTFL